MHEKRKLEETRYFLGRLSSLELDRNAYLFELSAFLTAARSVLQYALKEAKTKSGGQSWYDAEMKKRPVLGFFKDARDINIHERPTEPRAHIKITVTETLHMSDSIELFVRDAQGNLLAHEKTEPTPPPDTLSRCDTQVRYFFTNWSGTEDVQTLCEDYLRNLHEFVSDGVQAGFVTR